MHKHNSTQQERDYHHHRHHITKDSLSHYDLGHRVATSQQARSTGQIAVRSGAHDDGGCCGCSVCGSDVVVGLLVVVMVVVVGGFCGGDTDMRMAGSNCGWWLLVWVLIVLLKMLLLRLRQLMILGRWWRFRRCWTADAERVK